MPNAFVAARITYSPSRNLSKASDRSSASIPAWKYPTLSAMDENRGDFWSDSFSSAHTSSVIFLVLENTRTRLMAGLKVEASISLASRAALPSVVSSVAMNSMPIWLRTGLYGSSAPIAVTGWTILSMSSLTCPVTVAENSSMHVPGNRAAIRAQVWAVLRYSGRKSSPHWEMQWASSKMMYSRPPSISILSSRAVRKPRERNRSGVT